jgi:uncharacterized damage-inducible protein DinB
MAASDPVGILLAHDRWATREILGACAGLTGEQFHRRFEMGRGSLHDTLVHMLGAMNLWTQGLAGKPMEGRLEEDPPRTVEEIGALLETVSDAFAAEIGRLPLEGTMSRVRGGRTYVFTRGAVLAHVATHGAHHRAQCLNMLRQLGVSPLPASSVAEWTWLGENPGG